MPTRMRRRLFSSRLWFLLSCFTSYFGSDEATTAVAAAAVESSVGLYLLHLPCGMKHTAALGGCRSVYVRIEYYLQLL